MGTKNELLKRVPKYSTMGKKRVHLIDCVSEGIENEYRIGYRSFFRGLCGWLFRLLATSLFCLLSGIGFSIIIVTFFIRRTYLCPEFVLFAARSLSPAIVLFAMVWRSTRVVSVCIPRLSRLVFSPRTFIASVPSSMESLARFTLAPHASRPVVLRSPLVRRLPKPPNSLRSGIGGCCRFDFDNRLSGRMPAEYNSAQN